MPTFPGPLVGMVHLAALPGSPRASLRVEQIAKAAATEAKALEAAGFDAVLVENMHDLPYLRREVETAGCGAALMLLPCAALLCMTRSCERSIEGISLPFRYFSSATEWSLGPENILKRRRAEGQDDRHCGTRHDWRRSRTPLR